MRWKASVAALLVVLPCLRALPEEHLCASSHIQVDQNSFIYGKLLHVGSDSWEPPSPFSLCYTIEARAFLVESYSGLVDWEHGQWTEISQSRVFCTASYFIRLPMRDSRLKHSAQALGGALLLNLVVRKSHENSSSSDERGPAAAGANDTLAHEDSILASSMTYIDYTMGTALRQVNMTFLMQLLPPQREEGRKWRLKKSKDITDCETGQTFRGLVAAEAKEDASSSSSPSLSFNLTNFSQEFSDQCAELSTDFDTGIPKPFNNSTEQKVLVAILCLFSWLPLTMLVTWSTRLRHNEKAAVCDRLEAQSELYEKRLTDDIEEVLSRGSGMQSVIFLYSDEAGNNMCIPSPPLPQFSG